MHENIELLLLPLRQWKEEPTTTVAQHKTPRPHRPRGVRERMLLPGEEAETTRQ